ncbi:hypothetical protein N7532_003787 [Penicillium argentinense]|uniref:DUF7587 domain-containing protein n=1 Tax=Penicillium argentinense TaxID=1131581 RepID=A0A9W9KF11_9EURO|nr:uncharacterized protein N7532_003787 [Penicillium argentinense]KAJ5103258.1 hypothetical protein N7532_003787 [Penicillium argentinense]
MGEEEFLEAFKRHVLRDSVPSPFVSTLSSLLTPIHRALHRQDGASVAVIDSSKLSVEKKLYKAVRLVELTNTSLKNWKGYGEYEVWEETNPSSIVCSFSITSLMETGERDADIGRFLQIPMIRSKRYCTRFLRSKLAQNIKSYK